MALAGLFSACGSADVDAGMTRDEAGGTNHSSGVVASAELLVGRWMPEVEATWVVGREGFLRDTMRGRDAYPTDPQRFEQHVFHEVRQILADMVFTFRPDGTGSFEVVPGHSSPTRWVVDSATGSVLILDYTHRSRTTKVRVEFVSANRCRLTLDYPDGQNFIVDRSERP